MSYEIELSSQATKDLDRLDRDTRRRVLNRLQDLALDPLDPRLSSALTNKAGLRKSRIGGWRIIFTINQGKLILVVVDIERRGQVYKRL